MGFWQVIGAGWRDGLGAMRRNGPLLAGTFLAMLAIDALTQSTMPQWHPASHGVQDDRPFDLLSWLTDIARGVLYSIAATPLMVVVHRFVLLREQGQGLHNRRRLVRFAAWLTAYYLIPMLSSPFLSSASHGYVFVSSILNTGLGVGSFYIATRLVMSFPAAALDANQPFRDSWNRTSGHWWHVAGVMFLGFLPLLILIFVAFSSGSQLIWITAIAVINTLWPVLGAALASELYRKFGGLERREPQFAF